MLVSVTEVNLQPLCSLDSRATLSQEEREEVFGGFGSRQPPTNGGV
jgi:hypothetical protein